MELTSGWLFRRRFAALIEVQHHVVCRTSARDDVGPTVAIDVVDNQILTGDLVPDTLLCPRSIALVIEQQDADGRIGDAVAHDDLVTSIAVDVRAPNRMAALELVSQHR